MRRLQERMPTGDSTNCSKRDITKIIVGLVIEGRGEDNPPVEGVDYPCQCLLG